MGPLSDMLPAEDPPITSVDEPLALLLAFKVMPSVL